MCIGRGPGKLGGEEAVKVSSQDAPNAAEAENRGSERINAAFRTPDLTEDTLQFFQSRSKVHAS
jgi:hypothetical protein